MKIDNKTFSLTLLAIVVLVVGLYFKIGATSSAEDEKQVVHADKGRLIREIKTDRQKRLAALRNKRPRKTEAHPVAREKPNVMMFTDDEESKLNEFSKNLLKELQDALDSGDFKVVSRIARKLMEIPPDPAFGREGVSAVLRRKAVSALGWFGSTALPELVGMLGDPDPEIAAETFDQFTLALEDVSLSDYERADIVTMASKVLTNTDELEQLFMEINNMRHSVGAGALVEISMEGTDAAKSLMPDSIEFFTGEDNIETVEDMENWLAENPDGEDDDDLYGGMTD